MINSKPSDVTEPDTDKKTFDVEEIIPIELEKGQDGPLDILEDNARSTISTNEDSDDNDVMWDEVVEN